jgi:4-amino-4-deoxy-L-arabinose transferase-like glycosyltransferase
VKKPNEMGWIGVPCKVRELPGAPGFEARKACSATRSTAIGPRGLGEGSPSVVAATTTRRWRGPTVAQATLILIVLGLIWRTVRYALAFPLWGDEAFVAVNFLTRDLAGLARPLEFFQIVPPGFLWVEWAVVQGLGSSEWALRLVPYLAGVASLLLFWRFCRGVATRRTVLVAVAVLAASFYPVRYANEVKPYAVDLLISLMLTSLGWSVWRDIRSSGHWLALIGVTTLGVWCSYSAVFPAASVVLLLGARVVSERSSRILASWLSLVVLLVVSWGAMLVTFAGPQTRAAAWLVDLKTWRGAFPPLAQPWRLPWWLLDIHAGHMLAYPHGGHNFGSSVTFLLVIAGAVALWRRRARRPLLFLLLGPLPVAMVAAALRRYPYGTSARVMLYMAPAIGLLTGEGVTAVFRRLRWLARGPVVVAGLLALIPIVYTVLDLAMPYIRRDDVEHRRLARLLADRTAPGDQWVVFNSATPPPHVPELMVTRWIQRVAEVRFYLLSYAPVPTRWEPDPETVQPIPGGSVWFLIQRHGSVKYFAEGRLAAYQRILDERLGRPEMTRFSLADNESLVVCRYGSRP